MTLPEESAVVEILLAYLYEADKEELKRTIDSSTFERLLKVHAAAGKYLLKDVSTWALWSWNRKLSLAKPCLFPLYLKEPSDLPKFIEALEAINTLRMEIDVAYFLAQMTEILNDYHGLSFLSASTRHAIFKAWPCVMTTIVQRHLNKGDCSHYTARCSTCEETWEWNKLH